MSYQVLARKWRPQAFSQLVGQEHVVKALTHALQQQRLHHAYLFTGTRGVGKTTLGRLLAKCLNCESGITATPCESCQVCLDINAGRFIDLIEVDAASRTKVEDTRELLANVQYMPTVGRYKVYLIDEVHMLSGHSFNALLKTLEEPPEYVKFILATTDPDKLPVTVLSRCLRFHLQALTVDEISKQLIHITATENIHAEPAALTAIARAANGSMRDALSLLDQAIAHGGGQLATSEVQSMLGTIDRTQVIAILQAIAGADSNQALATSQAMAKLGIDYLQVLDELIAMLHQLALFQELGAWLEAPEFATELEQLSGSLSREAVQLLYQIALIGRRDCPLAPDLRQGFEMTLLRLLAFCPGGSDPKRAERVLRSSDRTPTSCDSVSKPRDSVSKPRDSAPTSRDAIPSSRGLTAGSTAVETPIAEPSADKPQDAELAAPAPAPSAISEHRTTPTPSVQPEPTPEPATIPEPPPAPKPVVGNLANLANSWTDIVPQLDLGGVARALISQCTVKEIDGERVVLALSKTHEPLYNPLQEELIATALSTALGQQVMVSINLVDQQAISTPAEHQQQAHAERKEALLATTETSPGLRALSDTFSTEVISADPS